MYKSGEEKCNAFFLAEMPDVGTLGGILCTPFFNSLSLSLSLFCIQSCVRGIRYDFFFHAEIALTILVILQLFFSSFFSRFNGQFNVQSIQFYYKYFELKTVVAYTQNLKCKIFRLKKLNNNIRLFKNAKINDFAFYVKK